MNLFGIEIRLNKNGDTPVRRKECHDAHNRLEKFLDTRFLDLNRRVDDIRDTLKLVSDLLKK